MDKMDKMDEVDEVVQVPFSWNKAIRLIKSPNTGPKEKINAPLQAAGCRLQPMK